MDIKTLQVGPMGTNCYLLTDPETSQTLILDPGDEADFISTTLLENHLIPTAIVLTHGHFDHCLATIELKLNFNLPVYLHPNDVFLYNKAHHSAKYFLGLILPQLPSVDHSLLDGDTISFGDSTLQVIHTPGHTPGSVSLVSPDPSPIVFTGDTLFADGVGRTDLSYSSASDLKESLHKLNKLPDNSTVYPGHGKFFLLQPEQLDL